MFHYHPAVNTSTTLLFYTKNIQGDHHRVKTIKQLSRQEEPLDLRLVAKFTFNIYYREEKNGRKEEVAAKCVLAVAYLCLRFF